MRHFLHTFCVPPSSIESAIAQAYNRLGPGDRTVALADPIVQGILSRYWQSFVGICLILLGFVVQLFANWMPVRR